MVLLRVLGFDVRLQSPLEWVRGYVSRAVTKTLSTSDGEDSYDYDDWTTEEKDEHGVHHRGDVMETRLGRAVRARVVEACKILEVGAGYWPMRAVAVGCVWVVLGGRGMGMGMGMMPVEVEGGQKGERNRREREWVREVTRGKVDWEDFGEILEVLGGRVVREGEG